MYCPCWIIPLLWLFHIREVFTDLILPQHPACNSPLGMESRKITDDQLYAPSTGYLYGFSERKSRLNGFKAYCTPNRGSGGFSDDVFMVIDLRDDFMISALALQGDKETPYSDRIKVTYSEKGEEFGDEDKSFVLAVHGKKGDEIEHVPIQPIIASKLKIQLEYTNTYKCVRIELYGCTENKNNKTYEECETKDEPILQNDYKDMKLSQTDSALEETKYTVEHLLYSNDHAWCLSSKQSPSYKHWAVIDMRAEYLIYGIEMKGLKQGDNIYGNIPNSFKLKYSLNGKNKSLLERNELLTDKYKLMKNLRVPFIARYIYVGMRRHSNEMTCIKLELFGCKVTTLFENKVLIPARATDKKEPSPGQISDVFLGLILLLVLTLIAVVTMGILLVKRKRNKSLPKRRGPLPEIPVYSNLNQNEVLETKEVYVDCKDPIYEDPNYASVADVNPYENTPFHKEKQEEKKYQNV